MPNVDESLDEVSQIVTAKNDRNVVFHRIRLEKGILSTKVNCRNSKTMHFQQFRGASNGGI